MPAGAVTAANKASGGPSRSVASRAELLRRFLNAYWLRPENAFWMTLRSEALAACEMPAPVVDVSCGDGVFTFIHCGGVFDPSFDVFRCVAGLDRVRNEHADMFDCADDGYDPQIEARAARTIDAGTDIKPSMLTKAERLHLYRRLIDHDSNKPLPLADASFATVYCNSAYWVEGIDAFLQDLRRITHPGGRVILHVKLDAMKRYTLESHRGVLGDRFLDIIGRGRLDCWPTLASRRTWEERFRHARLNVVSATPFVTRTHAHIWDIGLRPIAPLLVKMANALTDGSRDAIKADWVDLFLDLLMPICDPSFDPMPGDAEPAEVQYVLSPE